MYKRVYKYVCRRLVTNLLYLYKLLITNIYMQICIHSLHADKIYIHMIHTAVTYLHVCARSLYI